MSLRHLMRILGPGRKDGRNLTHEEAYEGFSAILSGSESEIRIGAFLVLLRTKIGEVLARIGLQPRLGWLAVALRRGERVLRRHLRVLAAVEIAEEQVDEHVDHDGNHEKCGAEAENGANVDVAVFVVNIGVHQRLIGHG